MQRLKNALSQGITGGIVAFVVAFIVGALLATAVAHSGHATTDATALAVSTGTILACSFGGLYFAIMFFGRLFEAKPATD